MIVNPVSVLALSVQVNAVVVAVIEPAAAPDGAVGVVAYAARVTV